MIADGTAGAWILEAPCPDLVMAHSEAMWVRLPGWMIADGEPPAPTAGSTLEHAGVRMLAGSLSAGDGREEIREVRETSPDQKEYIATGVIQSSRDYESYVNDQSQHAGCELVLAVDEVRLQVMTNGRADNWPKGMRACATGPFELVGEYEWEDFVLVDTRSSWLVRSVSPASNGDLMLDLVADTSP